MTVTGISAKMMKARLSVRCIRRGEGPDMSVGIVDYGRGNTHSVQKALAHLGYPSSLVSDPDELSRYRSVIIPGVGAFDDAMAAVRRLGMDQALRDHVARGRSLLGICLGMQILLSSGTEGGMTRGLDLIQGQVEHLSGPEIWNSELKLPHMGWNTLHVCQGSPLLEGVRSGTRFYFVHSYASFPACWDNWLGMTVYGRPFASVIARDQVYGTQFHPEKSGPEGLRVLENFVRLAGEKPC